MREPHEQMELLNELCVFGLTKRQFQILGGCAIGYSTEEMAAGLGLARATVFRHVDILQQRIFGLTDLPRSRCLLVAWTYAQRDCCAAITWKMIANHQLLENGDQRRIR